MDKVKVFLGYARKYHFWILCVLSILAGLMGWMMARGTLSEQYTANKGTVTGKFQSLKGIQDNPNPPNAEWTTAIAALTKQEAQEVETTWKSVYETQRQVLSWPTVMPDEFETWIKTAPPNAEIPGPWLVAYQTEVIKEEFPKLAQIVGAAPLGEADKKGKPDNAAATATVYKVTWDNQEEIRKSLEMLGSQPTTFQVRLRQEDYWVLQALLNIIRKTNEGAQYTARVKVIEDLAIGADTAKQFEKGMAQGHITKIATPGAGDADLGPPPEPPPVTGEPGGEAPPPDEGRYVDAEGKTLQAGTSQDQQFKRLPVYLKLKMDQRDLTRLLTECANYPLPVEVRQLRINPGGDAAPAQGQAQQAAGGGANTPAPGDVFDVTVEIHGIIYLFNPPDPAKLGTGAAESQSAG